MSGQGCTGVRREFSVGDPDTFANEMARLVNTKEYRLVLKSFSTKKVLYYHLLHLYSSTVISNSLLVRSVS